MNFPLRKQYARRESSSALPAHDSFRLNGQAPTPRYSLDATLNNTLGAWENIAERGFYLVHALTLEKFEDGDLSKMKAEDALKRWDVFSTSLIAVKKTPTGLNGLGEPGWGTQLACGVGLLLEVPPQNILGAFRKDVWFPTHAPTTNYEFSKRILSGKGKAGFRVKGGYNQILPPESLVHKGDPYNEVLVVGRPGTRVHFAQTGETKVVGIIYSQHSQMGNGFELANWNLIHKLQSRNPGLEVEVV